MTADEELTRLRAEVRAALKQINVTATQAIANLHSGDDRLFEGFLHDLQALWAEQADHDRRRREGRASTTDPFRPREPRGAISPAGTVATTGNVTVTVKTVGEATIVTVTIPTTHHRDERETKKAS